MVRRRAVAGMLLFAASAIALSACTRSGADPAPIPTTTVRAVTPSPSATPVHSATPTPSASAIVAPAAGAVASTAAIRRAFGRPCATTAGTIPANAIRSTIGDVDGDGKDDTEWALLKAGGTIDFGVTTASGSTISASVGYASGGSRSVSIGTLATGQTVALPTDGHVANLSVLHDCQWITPDRSAANTAFEFTTGYGEPSDGAGGGCIAGRLYQVLSDRTKQKDHETVSGIMERISADGSTVTPGAKVVFLTNENADTSLKNIQRYGQGQCQPSTRLEPIYRG